MPKIERVYNIPLRKEFLKAPKYRRAKKATNALKRFLSKHLKSEKVKLGKFLNKKIWERGIKNPPHHVRVSVVKDEEGIVTAELVGAPVEKIESEKKKEVTKEEMKEAKEEKIEKVEKREKTKEENLTEKKEEKKEEKKQQEEKKVKLHPEEHHIKKEGFQTEETSEKRTSKKAAEKIFKS